MGGACLEHVWSMFGACLEHVCSMSEACLEHVWSILFLSSSLLGYFPVII
jgi:hypothetical protein